MSRTIHCCVDLSALIHRNDKALFGLLRHYDHTARDADDAEIIARAVIMQAQGREAWPLCDNPDKLGHCKGHPNGEG